MKLWQELEGKIPVYGLGGIHTWRDEFTNELGAYDQVFVVLDNDSDYNVAHLVDDVWMRIRKGIGLKAKRIRLPEGTKDVCEFFELGYDVASLRKLAERGKTVSRFKPLDLHIDPPPVDWLWEGYVAKGDATLLSGVSNLGKSWLTMGLTVAVVDGHSSFLEAAIKGSGRVLYVDEENPLDVVYSRLAKLGLKNRDNLRYIWNNGVRLDKNPDILLEEIMDYQPELVILDSLTRIHSQEENQVGAMAPLLNDGLKPLARETGAAIVLIHHHDKAASGPRGSSDILNSVDGAIDAFASGAGYFRLRLSKSRRRLCGDEIVVKIMDRPNGTVALQVKSSGGGLF